METVSEPISVIILNQEYQFTCKPEERRALQDAAAYLDERMLAIKGEGRMMALERIAVMTALNLSDEVLKLQQVENHRKENIDSRIRILAEKLEDALEDQLG